MSLDNPARPAFYQPYIFSGFLSALALWTLAVKFCVPVSLASFLGQPPTTWVMWDLWWAVHLALAYYLARPRPWVGRAALAVSAAEIAIVLVKLALFFRRPVIDVWTLGWFFNKLAVLGVFSCLLASLAGSREDWKDAGF